jgi:hypothetical protein
VRIRWHGSPDDGQGNGGPSRPVERAASQPRGQTPDEERERG